MYHMNTPLSDFDLKYVYFNPRAYIMPFRNEDEHPVRFSWYYNPSTGQYNDAGEDNIVLSLEKFATELVKGNPNTVELLFYPYVKPLRKEIGHYQVVRFLDEVKPYVLTAALLRQGWGHVHGVVNDYRLGKLPPEKVRKRFAHARRLQIMIEHIEAHGELRVFSRDDADITMLRDFRTSTGSRKEIDLLYSDILVRHREMTERVKDWANTFPNASQLREEINQIFRTFY